MPSTRFVLAKRRVRSYCSPRREMRAGTDTRNGPQRKPSEQRTINIYPANRRLFVLCALHIPTLAESRTRRKDARHEGRNSMASVIARPPD